MTRLQTVYDTEKSGETYATEIPALNCDAYDTSNLETPEATPREDKRYKEVSDIINYATSEIQLKGLNNDENDSEESEDDSKSDGKEHGRYTRLMYVLLK